MKDMGVGPLPADPNIFTCKCVFTLKYDPNKTTNHHKAWLVAHGFSKTRGIEYKETFSPMVQINSTHILLSLDVNQGWSSHVLNVSKAFLDNDLIECVFIEKLHSYAVLWVITKVFYLHNAIYGLK